MGAACGSPNSGSTPGGKTSWGVNNIILLTDSYKISHWRQYPPGTEYVYSYFESRGCVVPEWTEVVFFGLQYFLKEYLCGVVVTPEKIAEAVEHCKHHFGAEFVAPGLVNPDNFNFTGWDYILKNCGGKLPITIKAVPEGTPVSTKTCLMTVENTDPKCFWLSNYLETLLVQVWYPMSVATQSREQKKQIMQYYKKTGCDLGKPPGGVCFALNDFGFRGVSSVESAMIGGAAHLVNFIGSDTMAAVHMAKTYYGAGPGSLFECPSFSIPASEHSTITSWGKDKELDAMKNMLEQYPQGLVACVSDSFDIFNACENYWGTQLKTMIESRPPPAGRLVVRPDSGEPTEIVPKVLEILLAKFGSTKTRTGHKLLPGYIRVIQGDGVSYITIPKILDELDKRGIAADNVCFGSGGALLQRLDRDTFKCAFKCAEIIVNGKPSPVFKDPITDPGKASKKGRLTLQLASESSFPADAMYKSSKDSGVAGGMGYVHKYGDWVTVAEGKGDKAKDKLVEVYRNGVLLKDWTFDEVRLRADLPEGPFVSAKSG
mmetsp:Transcript_55223/g.131638  ORF Transcript_55223/g.131638 Transcript_55223/m.131638 type:complete len:544 (-) Transcript_55223:147-1778(-)|eukprot:CAMPEP_0178414732 /NCGR_PEP_ID=MMETSP0689_2-20121128/23188_1 /TAXON_ID=160604 /ORGANISM="Amphidinium massartii, Strain CS-259" /LENGTH=543 /DNA_ID=CAMNT_0020036031 /DNA_START=73 /DNA_END=1704 /DNA_ORIENTATION=-